MSQFISPNMYRGQSQVNGLKQRIFWRLNFALSETQSVNSGDGIKGLVWSCFPPPDKGAREREKAKRTPVTE